MSQEHLSRRLGYSSNVLYLWERGRRLPTVGAFFRLAEMRRHPVHESVERFASAWAGTDGLGPRVPPVQALAYEQPWSHAVLHALELDAYRRLPRHRPAVLAEHLGLTSAAVEEHLARLHAARVIEKRDGLWREARKLSIDTRADFARNLQLKQHWAEVVLERLGRHEPRHQSLFSYNVFPIARAELAPLRELHIEYFQRVRQLVAGATGADHVVVMNMQLCVLDEAPAERVTIETQWCAGVTLAPRAGRAATERWRVA